MNHSELNRFFTTKNVISEIKKENFNYEKFIKDLTEKYSLLNREYRNEYFYKNTIFNKIVLGRYSLNTTVALSEINIGKSKADFVVINKKRGIVYEIKTELDNLERLVYQIMDYSKVFSEIYVVTSENNYYPVYKMLKESNLSAGILVLTSMGTLSMKKKPRENNNNLNHESLFKLLRKKEYEIIIKNKFKMLPNVKQVEYFKTSLNLFKKIDLKEAQELVFKQLWKRECLRDNNLIKKIPYEIRWLFYKVFSNKTELYSLLRKLEGF